MCMCLHNRLSAQIVLAQQRFSICRRADVLKKARRYSKNLIVTTQRPPAISLPQLPSFSLPPPLRAAFRALHVQLQHVLSAKP